jgi:hypothetical protein
VKYIFFVQEAQDQITPTPGLPPIVHPITRWASMDQKNREFSQKKLPQSRSH